MKRLHASWILLIVIISVVGFALGCRSPFTEGVSSNTKGLTTYTIATNPDPIGGPDSALMATLYAGKTYDVGTVEVWLADESLCVRYTTIWSLVETHFDVVADPSLFPQTNNGNPKPGQFKYKTTHDPGTSTYEFCVPIPEGDILYFAAHAEIEKWIDGTCVKEESAWTDGYEFPGANWATYFAGALPVSYDLTGIWQLFFTPDCSEEEPGCELEELGPISFCILQTDSFLTTDLEDFEGSNSGSSFTLNSVALGIDMTGTVSGSGDDIEINGTYTGEVLGGSGEFRIVPFQDEMLGTLFAQGTVNDVPIFIDTQFALGSGGETVIRYNYNSSIPLSAGWFSGNVGLQTNSELVAGETYTVVDGEPWEDDEIVVNLMPPWPNPPDDEIQATGGTVYIISCAFGETSGTITGTFNLDFDEFGPPPLSFISTIPVYRDVWYSFDFEVDGWYPLWIQDESNLMLWFHVDVENESGHVLTERTYISQPPGQEGDHWSFTPDWWSSSGSVEEFHINNPGTLTITHFDNDGIAGSFNASGPWGSLGGNFDVYFYEEWEPEGE